MYKTLAILLSLLLLFGILSCNLDGSGIFLTISKSTEIADSKLATEPVRDILYNDTTTDFMYILYRTSVKKANISSAFPNPTWDNVDFSRPISEAVFIPGPTHKLVYSSVHADDNLKSVYVGSFTTPTTSTLVTGLENVNVIDIIHDVTTDDVYIITYDPTTDIVSIYKFNISTPGTISTKTFSLAIAPTAVHFIRNGADTNSYFIFVRPDATQGYINSYLKVSDFSTAIVPTKLTVPVFDTSSTSDNATKDSPIIGAYADGTTIYLVTNEGILVTSLIIDDVGSTYTAVNNADKSEFMSIVLNPSGSTASIYSIPMTVVTKSDVSATKLLIIGGLSDIYYYDIANPTEIPVEFNTTSDEFYSNVSSTRILDFYNVLSDGNFSLFTATSKKWIWETVNEDTVSTQLL